MGKTWTYIIKDNSQSVIVMNTAQNRKSMHFLKFCNLYGATLTASKRKDSISVTMETLWKNHHIGQWPKEGNSFPGCCLWRLDQEHRLSPSNYSFLPTCSMEPAPGSQRYQQSQTILLYALSVYNAGAQLGNCQKPRGKVTFPTLPHKPFPRELKMLNKMEKVPLLWI